MKNQNLDVLRAHLVECRTKAKSPAERRKVTRLMDALCRLGYPHGKDYYYLRSMLVNWEVEDDFPMEKKRP